MTRSELKEVPSGEKVFSFHIYPIIPSGVTSSSWTTAPVIELNSGKYILGFQGGIATFDTQTDEQKTIYTDYRSWISKSRKTGQVFSKGVDFSSCYSLMLNDNNTRLFAGMYSDEITRLLMFDTSDHNEIKRAKAIENVPVHCMQKMKNGNLIVGGTRPGKINCYDMQNLDLLWSIDEKASCMAVVDDEKEKLLVIGSHASKFVKIYSLTTQEEIRKIETNYASISKIVSLGTDNIAIGGSCECHPNITIVNIKTSAKYYLPGGAPYIKDLILASNRYLIGSAATGVVVWDLTQKRKVNFNTVYGRIYLTNDNWLLVRHCDPEESMSFLSFHSFSPEWDQTYLDPEYIATIPFPLTSTNKNFLKTKVQEMQKRKPIPKNGIKTISGILSNEIKTISFEQRLTLYFEDVQSLVEIMNTIPAFANLWGIVLSYYIPLPDGEGEKIAAIPVRLQKIQGYYGPLIKELAEYKGSFGWRHHKDIASSLLETCSLFTISNEKLQRIFKQEQVRMQGIKANLKGHYYKIIIKYLGESERIGVIGSQEFKKIQGCYGSLVKELTEYQGGFGWRYHRAAASALLEACSFTISDHELHQLLGKEQGHLKEIKANLNEQYYQIITKHIRDLEAILTPPQRHIGGDLGQFVASASSSSFFSSSSSSSSSFSSSSSSIGL